MPFCALAIDEELAGIRTDVADPMLDLAIAQQPGERFVALQRELLDELAASFGLQLVTRRNERDGAGTRRPLRDPCGWGFLCFYPCSGPRPHSSDEIVPAR